MKTLTLATLLLCSGCATRPIKCRFVALDAAHHIRKDIPPGTWHPASQCIAAADLLQALPVGHFGLEVRGGRKSKKRFFDFLSRPEPPLTPQLSTTASMEE